MKGVSLSQGLRLLQGNRRGILEKKNKGELGEGKLSGQKVCILKDFIDI